MPQHEEVVSRLPVGVGVVGLNCSQPSLGADSVAQAKPRQEDFKYFIQ